MENDNVKLESFSVLKFCHFDLSFLFLMVRLRSPQVIYILHLQCAHSLAPHD